MVKNVILLKEGFFFFLTPKEGCRKHFLFLGMTQSYEQVFVCVL